MSPENVYKLPKIDLGLDVAKLVGSKGIVLSENQIWKHKRKQFSNIFNFNFIINSIPVLPQICDKVYSNMEN